MTNQKEKPTREELIGKRKTLISILIILAILALAYTILFAYTIYIDKWDTNISMAVVGLIVISVVSLVILRNLGMLNKQIKNLK